MTVEDHPKWKNYAGSAQFGRTNAARFHGRCHSLHDLSHVGL
jgi:hypothetical protein